jgi:hypothetical protein
MVMLSIVLLASTQVASATAAPAIDTRNPDRPPQVLNEPLFEEQYFQSIAEPWMAALKSGDAKTLASLTSLPFTFATTAPQKKCEGTMRTTVEMALWSKCFREAGADIFSRLQAGADMLKRKGEWGESKDFKDTADRIAPAGTWVQGYLQVYANGTRITNSFRFLIVGNEYQVLKVAAFLVGVEEQRVAPANRILRHLDKTGRHRSH